MRASEIKMRQAGGVWPFKVAYVLDDHDRVHYLSAPCEEDMMVSQRIFVTLFTDTSLFKAVLCNENSTILIIESSCGTWCLNCYVLASFCLFSLCMPIALYLPVP